MADTTYSPPDPAAAPSVTGLVSGILADAQELLKQQIALAKAEIRSDLQKTKQAVLSLALGAGVLAFGAVFLAGMLVAVLHEAAGLSWWASFGIVGGVFALTGGGLLYAGIQRLKSFNPLPDQTVEAFKENLRWMTNPK